MDKENIFEIYNEVMKKILLYGQVSLPEIQFKAFRKLVLDGFGGAERKIKNLGKKVWTGTD